MLFLLFATFSKSDIFKNKDEDKTIIMLLLTELPHLIKSDLGSDL